MQDCKVNILGTEYKVLFREEKDNRNLKMLTGISTILLKRLLSAFLKKMK